MVLKSGKFRSANIKLKFYDALFLNKFSTNPTVVWGLLTIMRIIFHDNSFKLETYQKTLGSIEKFSSVEAKVM